MTKDQIHESATDKLIGALMYQNQLLEKINENKELTAGAKEQLVSCMAKAASTCEWEINDREKKLIRAFFPDAEIKRDENLPVTS